MFSDVIVRSYKQAGKHLCKVHTKLQAIGIYSIFCALIAKLTQMLVVSFFAKNKTQVLCFLLLNQKKAGHREKKLDAPKRKTLQQLFHVSAQLESYKTIQHPIVSPCCPYCVHILCKCVLNCCNKFRFLE